jgi:hypothetical protein
MERFDGVGSDKCLIEFHIDMPCVPTTQSLTTRDFRIPALRQLSRSGDLRNA